MRLQSFTTTQATMFKLSKQDKITNSVTINSNINNL